MTKNSKATREALEDLHGQLAKDLTRRIKTGEATAADLSVARQFLKDNNIDSIAKPGNPLGALADSLPFPDADAVRSEEQTYRQ
jgi:hypothetical protein